MPEDMRIFYRNKRVSLTEALRAESQVSGKNKKKLPAGSPLLLFWTFHTLFGNGIHGCKVLFDLPAPDEQDKYRHHADDGQRTANFCIGGIEGECDI
jgi:hypothetical protein